MVIQESIEIHAPLDTVWQIFSAMEDWPSWNTVCQNCCLIEGDRMAKDTCFTFEMRPYYLPIKVDPKITKCDPGKEVIWEGSRFGVHAVHRFTFEEKQNGVILTSVEKFEGAMLWLSKLIFIPSRLHRLTRKLMSAIKHQAESCAASAAAP